MRSFAIISIAALLAPFTAAELHTNGVCVDWVGGAAVYNAAATEAACGNYLMRNTGSEQWDTCPDCKMVTVGGLASCNSVDWHIGGDELLHYCKLNGAGASLTS